MEIENWGLKIFTSCFKCFRTVRYGGTRCLRHQGNIMDYEIIFIWSSSDPMVALYSVVSWDACSVRLLLLKLLQFVVWLLVQRHWDIETGSAGNKLVNKQWHNCAVVRGKLSTRRRKINRKHVRALYCPVQLTDVTVKPADVTPAHGNTTDLYRSEHNALFRS
jgi:hypothetical protein